MKRMSRVLIGVLAFSLGLVTGLHSTRGQCPPGPGGGAWNNCGCFINNWGEYSDLGCRCSLSCGNCSGEGAELCWGADCVYEGCGTGGGWA